MGVFSGLCQATVSKRTTFVRLTLHFSVRNQYVCSTLKFYWGAPKSKIVASYAWFR